MNNSTSVHLKLRSLKKVFSQRFNFPHIVTFSSGSFGKLMCTKFECAICLTRFLFILSILEKSNSIMTVKHSITSSTASRRLSALDPENKKLQFPSFVVLYLTKMPYFSDSLLRFDPSRPTMRPQLAGSTFLRTIFFLIQCL